MSFHSLWNRCPSVSTNKIQGTAMIPDLEAIMWSRVHNGSDVLCLSLLQHHHHCLKKQAISAPKPWRRIYTQYVSILRRVVVDVSCQSSKFEPFVISNIQTTNNFQTKKSTFISTQCPWPCPKICITDNMYGCLILMHSLQEFLSQELH